MALKLVTDPAKEPVNIALARSHCRASDTEDEILIRALISTAREYAEGYQNRAYITQTFELWLDRWPSSDKIKIPRPPLRVVNSIKYYGTDDTEYTMDTADYFVDIKSEPGRVALGYSKTWPTTTLRPTNAICVEFDAGYGDASTDVPQRVRQAMLLIIGHLYIRREESTEKVLSEIPLGVKVLLGLDRIWPI